MPRYNGGASYGACAQCGYAHWYSHDWIACNARYGRVVEGDTRDPIMVCAICGALDHFYDLLWHLKQVHPASRVEWRSGSILRVVRDIGDL